MTQTVAALVFAILILGLFWLDRDERHQISGGLWVAVIWLAICGSRPLSNWMPPIGLASLGGARKMAIHAIEGSPIDRIVYTTLLVLGLMVLVPRRKAVGRFLRANSPILLFFLYAALSILWSDYPEVTFKHWIRGVGDVVMVLVVLTDSKPDVAFKRLLSRAAFLLIPLSVLLIKYLPEYGRVYHRWTWTPMYAGVAETKNGLGVICLVFGLALLWGCFTAYRELRGAERRRRMIAYGTTLVMALWLFSLSDSMTSLACFGLAGGLMVVTGLSRFARKPAVLHLLVAAIIGLPLFALFSGTGGGLIESLGRDQTLTGRTGIWKIVLSLTGNPLVGTGYESFWIGQRLEQIGQLTMEGLNEAHNGYLEFYLNLGWVGVSLLTVLIVTGYRNVLRTLRRDPVQGSIGLAFFVDAVLYSLTEAGFRMMSPVWIAFLLAITAVPKAVVPEGSPALATERVWNAAEAEPQLDHVFHVLS